MSRGPLSNGAEVAGIPVEEAGGMVVVTGTTGMALNETGPTSAEAGIPVDEAGVGEVTAVVSVVVVEAVPGRAFFAAST